MDFIIKVAFAVIFFITAWLYQEENQEWVLLRDLLKDSNNIALQGAAIQGIDPHDKSRGRLIIDSIEAENTYEGLIRLNLGLDENNEPLPGSRLKTPVHVTYFEIIDDTNRLQPFPYLHEVPEENIVIYLTGPAIIAVIETAHPKLIRFTKEQANIRVPAIYEYKPNRVY